MLRTLINQFYPSTMGSDSMLINFYDPRVNGKDYYGRTLQDILSWSNHELERSHNYIQWVFPLPEPGMANAPIVTRRVMEAFRSRPELRDRLEVSFATMASFYGFEVVDLDQEQTQEDGEAAADEAGSLDPPARLSQSPQPQDAAAVKLVRCPKWRERFRDWRVRFDHNHLRITRIIRCLRLLGLEAAAKGFYAAIMDACADSDADVSATSRRYWKRAITYPLHMAPDGIITDWLVQWEEEGGAMPKEEESSTLKRKEIDVNPGEGPHKKEKVEKRTESSKEPDDID